MPKNKNKKKHKNKTPDSKQKQTIDYILPEPPSSEPKSQVLSQESGKDGSASASGDGDISSIIRVPGGEGAPISMENVKQALADFNFHVKDVGEGASEVTIPGAISSGKELRVNIVRGGDKEDCRILTALLDDTPDRISSYYMHHPDKYFFDHYKIWEKM